jgi:aldehyde:ferredoxin oxidoreductase
MGNLTSNIALIVDLATGETTQEAIEDDFYLEHLGGAAANLALYEQYRDDDPIILGTGLLTGTLFPGAALGVITAKSPRTGEVCHAPFCLYGGMELKYTGFDFVVIKGQAEKPVYLWLHDQVANIHDAAGLWGKDTWQTTDELRLTLGEDLVQVLSIGQAGERESAAAEICLNYWSTGDRWGFGKVLGAKKVKAIALRGLGIFDLAQPEEFLEECAALHKTVRSGSLSQYRGNIEFPDYLGDDSVKEWVQPLLHRCKACFGCSYTCNTFLKYGEDPAIMQETEVPEPGFLVTDAAPLRSLKQVGLTVETAARVLELCARQGVDPVAVASQLLKRKMVALEDIQADFWGIIEAINPEQVQPWSPDIAEAQAELAITKFSPWTPPQPLFADWQVEPGAATTQWWLRRNALAYIMGICPIFAVMAPELDEEKFLQALRLGTELDLSQEHLDNACRRLIG